MSPNDNDDVKMVLQRHGCSTILLCLLPGRTSGWSLVKGGIVEIDVFLIHFFFAQAKTLAKALEMDDLALAQEADDVVHIGVIA